MQTVLVVEENAIIRFSFSEMLASWGYHVLEAEDQSEALRVASQYGGSVDLLVANFEPPKLDAHALAIQLKRFRPELRVLIVSTHKEHRLPISAHDRFLEMPVGPKHLLTAVQDLMRWPGLQMNTVSSN